jgi:EAL domain-containing protein (putative c-di-GMP-specific phosphodiesterase class I)
MATRIDRWVVRHTFEWLAQAVEREVKIELVAINLSGQSIGDRAFHQHLFEMIRHARFDLRKVCFEITETAAITNLVDARQFVDEVRRLGAKVALDDFGAGASSFGYLKNLIVDFLKIDGQFITDMLEDKLDEAAVRCFNEVARVAGVTTIAEFVERQDVLEALHGIGINMAQGYLIHRPEPLESLVANSVRV